MAPGLKTEVRMERVTFVFTDRDMWRSVVTLYAGIETESISIINTGKPSLEVAPTALAVLCLRV